MQKHDRRALTLMTLGTLVLFVSLTLMLQARTVTAREMLHPCPDAGEDYTQDEHDSTCGTHTATPGPGPTHTATATASKLTAPRLSARHAGANAIDLNWTPVTGAVRYVLWTQKVADPGWQPIDGGNLRGTSYTDSGLTPGVTYQYAVHAIDGNGQPLGRWSNSPTATVPESGASTPTPTATPVASTLTAPALTAEAGEGAVELSWEAVPGAARYELKVWWASLPDWQPIGGTDGTTYTHSGLTAGRKYFYTIRAVNAAGERSDWQQAFASATVPESGASTPTPTATLTPNRAPTVSAAITDATIVNESETKEVSLSGVFSDADNDALTITAASSDETKATVSVASDYSSLTVTAKSRGTAAITVMANDGKGGTVEDAFTVTVKAAPVVSSAISDISAMELETVRDIGLSGVFSDGDGDALTITAETSDFEVVEAFVFRGTLTLLALAEGSVTITVTAEDADGNAVSDTFDVSVTAPQQ